MDNSKLELKIESWRNRAKKIRREMPVECPAYVRARCLARALALENCAEEIEELLKKEKPLDKNNKTQ